ncbi:MAG: hypothetical protein Q9174_006786, partial [Haloplaca sp. 1 TL-2023]
MASTSGTSPSPNKWNTQKYVHINSPSFAFHSRPTPTHTSSSQWGAASIVVYVPAVGLTKVAILLFYLRLNPEKRFRMIVYAALALTLAYVIALSLTILFECNPVAGYWDPFLNATCLDQQKLTLSNSILNVIFDFIVLVVPIPMLLKLQVSTRQKLVVGALFSLGSITCVVSAVRIYYQEKVFTGGVD